MASVGQITASLIAQTQQFMRPVQAAQKQLGEFQKRADAVKQRLDQISQAGKGAGIALAALSGTIGVMVRQASQTADAIDTMAKQIGLSAEQVQGLSIAAQRSNADMATLQTGLRGFARRTAEAVRGNEAFAKEFRRLGIQITDAEGNIRPIYDLLFEVADAVQNLGTEAEASAALMNLMSDAGRQLVPLMRQGGDAIRGMIEEAENMGLIITQAQIDAINDFQDQLDILGLQFRAAGVSLSANLIPALQVVISWVQRGVQWFQNLSDETRRQIIVWGAVAAGVLGAIVVFTLLVKAIGTVIGAVRLFAGIISALTVPFKILIPLIMGAAKVIGVVLAAAMTPVGIAILKIIAIIAGVIAAVKLAKAAWENNWLGIRDAVTNAWAVIEPILNTVIEFGGKVLSTAWTWTVNAIGAMWDWITGPLASWIGGAVSTTWNFITGTIPDLISRIIGWFGSTVETTWNIATGKAEAVIEAISQTLEGITGTVDTVWNWTLRGLDPFIRVLELIKDFGGRALDWALKWGERILAPVLGLQAGGILAGAGGPDSIPAVLAPGEAVIPFRVWRQGLAAIAEWFKRQGAPGFQTGGIAGGVGGLFGDLPQTMLGGFEGILSWIVDALAGVATAIIGEERAAEIANFFATIKDELGLFIDALTGATQKTEEAGERISQQSEEQITLWQRVSRRVADAWQSAASFVQQQAAEAVASLKAFGVNIAQSLSPLGLMSQLVTELSGPVEALITPISVVAQAITAALEPAIKALFPAIKFFGSLLLSVAKLVGGVWNALIELVSLIPFVNLRRYKVNLDELSSAQKRLNDLTWDAARRKEAENEAVKQTAQAMRNVPNIFRQALRTAQASGAGLRPVTLTPAGAQPFSAAGLRPTALPVASASTEGDRPTVEININISGPVYGMRDFEQQVYESLARALRRLGMAETGLAVKLV